jgi:hypothetical protein
MNTQKAEMKKERQVTDLIRNELASETNRRFLTRMNAFKLEAGVPDQLMLLLRELDRAEVKR